MRQLPRKCATEQKSHCSKLLDRLSVKKDTGIWLSLKQFENIVSYLHSLKSAANQLFLLDFTRAKSYEVFPDVNKNKQL